MKYHRLSILEIVYFNEGVFVNEDVEACFLRQLDAFHNEIMCVSIVVIGDILENDRLWCFIKRIKSAGIAISLTLFNCRNIIFYKSIKSEVGQIRINIENNMDSCILRKLFMQLKTPLNNVVFLFEINRLDSFKPYAGLLEENQFIYNISYSSSISHDSYWELAKYVSELKKKYPLKIIQEFTCAGVKFNNIEGVCPAKTSLMCVDINGSIKYCFRDYCNHCLNIFDGEFDELFDKLGKNFPKCSIHRCNELEYEKCHDGCPLDIKYSTNIFCLYNKGEFYKLNS